MIKLIHIDINGTGFAIIKVKVKLPNAQSYNNLLSVNIFKR